jgi:hypothetical protein
MDGGDENEDLIQQRTMSWGLKELTIVPTTKTTTNLIL